MVNVVFLHIKLPALTPVDYFLHAATWLSIQPSTVMHDQADKIKKHLQSQQPRTLFTPVTSEKSLIFTDFHYFGNTFHAIIYLANKKSLDIVWRLMATAQSAQFLSNSFLEMKSITQSPLWLFRRRTSLDRLQKSSSLSKDNGAWDKKSYWLQIYSPIG